MFGLPVSLLLKIGAGVVIVGLALGFYWHHQHIKAEAAKVPLLETQLKAHEKADKDRAKVDQLISDFQTAKADILAGIRKAPRPAVARIADCAPDAIDRELRNNAVAKLLPQPTGAAE